MKKLIFLITILLVVNAQGQFRSSMFKKNPIINLENFDEDRIYWGYYLGFSSFDYQIKYKNEGQEIVINSTTGFNVGIVGDLKLSSSFNLRFEPGLYVTQRNFRYPGFTESFDIERDVKATNINFPFLLKYSALRTGNIRPYLEVGLSTTLNLASNEAVTDDNKQRVFRVKRITNNFELGFGIDFYTEYFKFSPSIRGVFGTGDELIRDRDPNSPWTSNIESLSTRAVLINFTFH